LVQTVNDAVKINLVEMGCEFCVAKILDYNNGDELAGFRY